MISFEQLLAQSDEEWEEMVRNFTDDELITYFREFEEVCAQNPDSPAEFLEDLRAKRKRFEESVEKEKIAHRAAAIATAKLERAADALLLAAHQTDRSKGN